MKSEYLPFYLQVEWFPLSGTSKRPKKIAFIGPTLHVVDAGEKLHLATHRGPDVLAKSLETPVTSSAI